ncbi:MAG TPA: UDP-4-amino-4,6-dideoxy-N-acetyl-beta-L-altrosamine transaminase [Thermoanaerobaculia bacterium]
MKSISKLAIEGGTPVRASMLPYGRQSIDAADEQAVLAALRSDFITTGPLVNRFETAFAERVGARFAVAVSSGTAALHAAMFAAGIGPDMEVIVPAMTFAASANCARYQGGNVVFVDVRDDNLNVDIDAITNALTAKTRAVVAVDFAGHPAVTEQIRLLAKARNLSLIEDASHALGATLDGKRVGSLADMTTFSFHPVKHITTGEGGMITTDDPELAARLRRFRNHGITTTHSDREKAASWYYEQIDLGYNYRLTDIQCALGLSQLARLDGWLERRRAIAARYNEAFARLSLVRRPTVLPGADSAWHLYLVRVRNMDRGKVFRALRAENIGVNVHYIPVPWHPYYQDLGYTKGQWPVSEQAYAEAISLPMFATMTDRDVNDVIDAVEKVLER